MNSRKPRLVLFFFVGTVVALLSATPARTQIRQEQAKLTNVVGQVQVLQKGGTTWQPAKVGMVLSAGDEIRAAEKSGAELAMVDGSAIMVFARSRLQIRQLTTETATRKQTSWFHLVVGLARYIVLKPAVVLVGSRQDVFAVSTPTAVVAVRGTEAIAGTSPEKGESNLLCLDGLSHFAVLTTGADVFCAQGQLYQVKEGRLELLFDVPRAVVAALLSRAPATLTETPGFLEIQGLELSWGLLDQDAWSTQNPDLGPSLGDVLQFATLPIPDIQTAAAEAFTPAIQPGTLAFPLSATPADTQKLQLLQQSQPTVEATPFIPGQ